MLENIRNAITRLTNGPTATQLGWSYHTMSPTCPPWCGCHGNGRCLATAHWTFCSYGRLEAERVNQFRWNLVHNSMLGPQWQSRNQILKFSKFKMADGRHVGKYWKYRNSPSNGPIWKKLIASHHVPDMSAKMRLPWQRPLPSNGAVDIQQLWASGGRTREVVQIWWNLVHNSKFRQQWQSCDQILKVKIQNGGRSLLESIRNAILRWADWDDSWVVSAAKLFPSYLVVTANRTLNVLVLWDAEIKNIHNFDETVPLWYKKYKMW